MPPRVWFDTSNYRPTHRASEWCATLNNARQCDLAACDRALSFRLTRKTRITWLACGVEHGPLRDDDWITPEDYNSEEAREARLRDGVKTPHLQIAFQTEPKVEWKTVVARLPQLFDVESVTVFPCMGGLEDQRNYCSKEGDYMEIGEARTFERASRPEPGKRKDLEDIKEELIAGTCLNELREKYFGTFAVHESFLRKYSGYLRDSNVKKLKLTELESITWRPWQQTILDIATGPVQNRKVHIVVDKNGNSGKSFLSNYLALKHGFLLLNPVSKKDMAYILCQTLDSGNDVCGVIIDIARSIVGSGIQEHLPNTAMMSVFNFVEALHDGRITSTKYDSKTLWFPQPHVFIFTNHEVEIRSEYTLSADRWNVMNLRAGVLVQHTGASWD
jgi:hypothetical protein